MPPDLQPPHRARAAAPPTSLDLLVDVETPEQVTFSYTIAGVGSRAAAALVDGGICVALYLALLYAVDLALKTSGSSVSDISESAWGTTVILLGQFAIFWG